MNIPIDETKALITSLSSLSGELTDADLKNLADRLEQIPNFDTQTFSATLRALVETVEGANNTRQPPKTIEQQISEALKNAWIQYEVNANAAAQLANEITNKFNTALTKEDRKELSVLKAWCSYREAKWEDALQHIKEADDHPRALECELYLRSYRPEFFNLERINELSLQIGKTINAANAFIIRARSSNPVNYDEVLRQRNQFTWPPQEGCSYTEVQFANLLHNTARVFMDTPRDHQDLNLAEELLNESIIHYGSGDQNLHARAAANFWLSHLYEKQGELLKAAVSAQRSANLWLQQLSLQRQNPSNFEKFRNASRRAAEMREIAGATLKEIEVAAHAA